MLDLAIIVFSNTTANMPKEIGISNKDFGTYLKDDPSESELPTNSLCEHLFLSHYVLGFLSTTTVETHNLL